MATVASRRRSARLVKCDRCGDTPVAPDYAEYFSAGELVLYLWCCPNCGNRFATESLAAVGPEAERQAVQAFWPSLLVG